MTSVLATSCLQLPFKVACGRICHFPIARGLIHPVGINLHQDLVPWLPDTFQCRQDSQANKLGKFTKQTPEITEVDEWLRQSFRRREIKIMNQGRLWIICVGQRLPLTMKTIIIVRKTKSYLPSLCHMADTVCTIFNPHNS